MGTGLCVYRRDLDRSHVVNGWVVQMGSSNNKPFLRLAFRPRTSPYSIELWLQSVELQYSLTGKWIQQIYMSFGLPAN